MKNGWIDDIMIVIIVIIAYVIIYYYCYNIADYHKKAFEDAVKIHHSFHTYMAQCLPFGPPGVGKTCLLRRLIDEKLEGTPAKRDELGSGSRSTGILDKRKMIQVPIPKAIMADTKSGEWKEIKRLEDEVAVFVKTVNNVSDHSHLQQLLKPLKTNVPVRTFTTDRAFDDTDTPDTVSVELHEVLQTIEPQNMSKTQMLLDKSMTIFYTDTGGQPEFQEVLPALVAGPTIFLLIFSLAEGLDSKYKVVYRLSYSKESRGYESSFTVKEIFMQCLSSIASYHNALSHDVALLGSKSSVPPFSILAIGTHRDLVSEAEVADINKKLRDLVEQTSLYRDGCIEYSTHDDEQLVITVDNYNYEVNDIASVKKVVEMIVTRKRDGESPYRIEFPVPWLALELFLRNLPESTVTYEKCVEVAKKCNISEEHLPDCLWFLHHKTGTIRYYGSIKELKNTIIIQPSVIFEAVTEIIANTFTSENFANPQIRDFKTLGLFKRGTLQSYFKLHQDKLQISCDAFLALLYHLNILGPVHNPEYDYFLPCALVHAPDPPSEINLDPLLVVFKGGFVPKGVFSALLAYLLREMKWRIQHCNRSPLLYRNQASFYADSDDENCTVTLKAKAECFEVRVEGNQACGAMDSQCQILEKAISNVCENLRYDQSFCEQSFGFYCNLPECADVVNHIAVVDCKTRKIECPYTKKRYSMNRERELWFIPG